MKIDTTSLASQIFIEQMKKWPDADRSEQVVESVRLARMLIGAANDSCVREENRRLKSELSTLKSERASQKAVRIEKLLDPDHKNYAGNYDREILVAFRGVVVEKNYQVNSKDNFSEVVMILPSGKKLYVMEKW